MTAIAGPQPLEKTVAPAPPSEIDWAGPYIGFNVGVVWTNYDVSKYRTDVDFEDQFYQPTTRVPVTAEENRDYLAAPLLAGNY